MQPNSPDILSQCDSHRCLDSVPSTTMTADPPLERGSQREKTSSTATAKLSECGGSARKGVQSLPDLSVDGSPRRSDTVASTAAGRLRAVVLRIQWEMSVGQMDGIRPSATAWDELVALTQSRIRAAVRAAGAFHADADDCIQETWLEVLKGIGQLDPRSTEKGITCWLQTIAWRTTVRIRRREAQGVFGCAMAGDRQLDSWEDPESDDPADALIDREAKVQLRQSIEALHDHLGAPVHSVIACYLAGETNLTEMARDLHISRGRMFHRWRTALRYLRADLA